MRATILYILIHSLSLFSFSSSVEQLEDYAFDPLRQCTKNFIALCEGPSGGVTESVQSSFCFPFRTSAQIPINTKECYSTCSLAKGGCVRCNAIENTSPPLPVTVSDFYNIYQLRSPGDNGYGPNIICDYHIRCKPGQSMMYRLVTHELESPPNEGDLCPDTLTVYNTFPASNPTCGVGLPDRKVFFSSERMFTSFASNSHPSPKEEGGFLAFAFCVNDDAHFNRHCDYIPPRGRRDDALDRDKRSFRTPHFTVKPGQVVRYFDNTVIVEWTEGTVIHAFKNIQVLQTYNQFERFVTYKNTAGDRFFPGFGKLRIGYGIVQYTQSDIDPQFFPSFSEESRMALLMSALTAFGFFESDRFHIISPLAGPTAPPPTTKGPCSSLDMNSDIVNLAERCLNSCNGFLRATAHFFLEVIDKCDRSPGPALP